MKPEESARQHIDTLLTAAGWIVQSYANMNLGSGIGLAITEFPGAHGPADYLLASAAKMLGISNGQTTQAIFVKEIEFLESQFTVEDRDGRLFTRSPFM